MSKDKDVVMLQNVCQRLKADNRELREQMLEKQKKQDEIDAKVKSDTKHFREFCEMVLAKDKGEMVLGKEYSWDKLDNAEICQKAVAAYIKYNEESTKNIKKILAKFEKQGEELDGLKLQFARLLNGGKISADEANEILDDPSKIVKEEKVKENIDHTFKVAADEGYINAVVEEDSDLVAEEIEEDNPLMKDNVSYKITANAPKVVEAPKRVKNKNNVKKEMIEHDMYKVKDMVEKFNDLTWLIVEVIGKYGCSLRRDILEQCMKIAKKRKMDAKYGSVSRELSNMSNVPDLITVEKIKIPAGGFDVIQLARIGITVFENRFDKSPVKSEAKIIQEEHDNLVHGYGIVSLGKALIDSRRFEKVNVMNKKHAIEVNIKGSKAVYVPDMICVDKNGETFYYEYELANHNMKNFRYKCDKMMYVSSVLRFVVPSKEVARELKPKIDNWISENGRNRLKNTKVLVYTYKSLIEDNPATIEYDLSTSEAPIVDKSGK